MFSLFAEIERELISMRTKEALADKFEHKEHISLVYSFFGSFFIEMRKYTAALRFLESVGGWKRIFLKNALFYSTKRQSVLK